MRPNLTRPLIRIPRRNKHPPPKDTPHPIQMGKGGKALEEKRNGSSARKNRTSGNSERKRKSCSPPGPGPGDRREGRPKPGKNQYNRFVKNQAEPDDGSTGDAPGPAKAQREGTQGPRGRDPPPGPAAPTRRPAPIYPRKNFFNRGTMAKKNNNAHPRASAGCAHETRTRARRIEPYEQN